MDQKNLTRRDFSKLSLAALGGALIGCAEQAAPPSTGSSGAAPDPSKLAPAQRDTATVASDNPLMSEPHVCRGLNTCKGNGAGGNNDCAGQGACATAEAHACHTHNDCKGQGGCGSNPGENACKGQGKCGVPLSDKAWAAARKNFESAMTSAGKKLGAAPAKAG